MSRDLSLYTFGGLRILKAGEPLVGVDTRKVAALFLYLALAERPKPRELLADLLWDDRTQQQAQANLRRVLSGVRKHFSPYVEIDRSTASIVWGEDVWLDARELQSGIEPLKAGPGSLSPQAAAQVNEALALYHGDFLAGFHVRGASGFEAWLTEQRSHWQQVVLEAAATLASYYETTRSFAEGIALTRRALQIDPLQETAHRQMMRLLALSGRRAEALLQYEQCCQVLEAELAVPPDAETKALFEAIASGEFVAETPLPPASPGRQIDEAQPRSQPEERSVPNNLPIQTTPFIGRENELEALDKLLENPDTRLVTIVGPGGIGKTRLALAAAERQLSRKDGARTHPYEDGVYFIPLAPVGSPEGIVLALAEKLEILFHGNTAPTDQILEYLERQRYLLIFDNFEHLMDGAEFVVSILEHAPHVTILVTCRERLLLTGEAVLWLGGLTYPEEGDIELTTLEHTGTEYGAVNLFLHHARLIRPDLKFDQDRLAKVARICRLVEGMPLAIILAVSWIEALSLDELAETIANNMDILASEQRDLPPRQRSIRAAFESSWTRLSPTDQAAFAKLSVFRGGFDRAAAEAVAGANLLTLRTLIEKSMLAPANQERYEVHELLRQFGEGKLVVSGELDGVEQAHGRYYLGYLDSLEADVKGRRQIEAFNEIEADLNNIQKAWVWGLEREQFPLVDAAMETLTVFCHYTSRAHEGHELFRAARGKLVARKEQRLLGRLLARHAWLRAEYGLETNTIPADLDRSWKIAEQLEDQREMAMVQLARGYYHMRVHGDLAAGLREFELASQTCQALDDRFYLAILLTRIGYCQMEDAVKFTDSTRQSLGLALEAGNQYEAITGYVNLGAISMLMGDTNAGEQMWHRALALEARTGSSYRVFPSNELALAGFLRGDLAQMKRYLPLQEHVTIGKSTIITVAYVSATRALLAVVNGDLDMAEGLARRNLDFHGDFEIKMLAHLALAMICVDRGNLAEARQQLTAVYGIPNTTAYPGFMTRSLPVAALTLARGGKFERAAQVLSLALYHPASQVGWLRHWSSGKELRADLEQSLGEAAFKAAWEEGKSLDLVETIGWLEEEFSGEA